MNIYEAKFVLYYMRGNPKPELFDLIACKFIINLPREELTQQRIAFHFEKAYFYYLDTFGLPGLESNSQKSKQQANFYNELLRIVSCPQLPKLTGNQMNYCSIPVNGIIILNLQETHALLVESHCQTFGFPKGKANEGQKASDCAIREVKQQIGLSIQVDQNYYVDVDVPKKIGNKVYSKPCKFYILKIDQSCIVPRKHKKEVTKDPAIKQILHSATEIKSIGWYHINDQIPKLIKNGLLNNPSRIAFEQLMKKINKTLNYREKKINNPLEQFKGFDKAYGQIFLK